MKRGITFRESLLRNVIALMVILGGAILLTMVIASRASAKRLSQQIIDSSMLRADAQFQRFFDEVDRDLQIVAGWAANGMLDDLSEDNLVTLNNMLQPVLAGSAQTSSLFIADLTGAEYMLLRLSDQWQNRLTRPDGSAPLRYAFNGTSTTLSRSRSIPAHHTIRVSAHGTQARWTCSKQNSHRAAPHRFTGPSPISSLRRRNPGSPHQWPCAELTDACR